MCMFKFVHACTQLLRYWPFKKTLNNYKGHDGKQR